MSNRSGRDEARDQAPDAASPPGKQTIKGRQGNGKPPRRSGPTRLKSPQSLERLRDRIKTAAHELERLHKENAALAERIRALEARPAVDLDGTVLAFDEDPDALREKVAGFIEAIDTYLARESP